MAANNKKILRILDANYNRSKEGLRVLEDIFRFLKDNYSFTRKLRRMRHNLENAVSQNLLIDALSMRNTNADVGRNIDKLDLERKTLSELIISNFQRVKESLRVMEEIAKLINVNPLTFKNMRYKLYELEKEVFKRKFNISHTRRRHRKQK